MAKSFVFKNILLWWSETKPKPNKKMWNGFYLIKALKIYEGSYKWMQWSGIILWRPIMWYLKTSLKIRHRTNEQASRNEATESSSRDLLSCLTFSLRPQSVTYMSLTMCNRLFCLANLMHLEWRAGDKAKTLSLWFGCSHTIHQSLFPGRHWESQAKRQFNREYRLGF